jgi:RNA polymerase-binding protein DksA
VATNTDYQTLRASLQQKLDQLQRRVGKIERDLRQTPEPDSEERAIGRENDEVLEQLDSSSREELQQLQTAISRIDAGTYGVCATCGEQIAQQRLEALPYAQTCINCAA